MKHMQKFVSLRKKHPKFIYKSYSYKLTSGNLKIVFDFRVEPDIRFKPEITIRDIKKPRLKKIGDRVINNFVFHLGLMEIPSYWKSVCSPEIIISAGYLNKEQIKWWKDLIIKGMGQFFYENKIDWRKPNFLTIKDNRARTRLAPFEKILKDRYLVPMREGKDSIVTLEKLKKQKRELGSFSVNPSQATKNVLKAAGIKKPMIVERKIDPALLKLNKKGYLNGHTPFPAVLSFLSVFCAVLFDYKNIAFSNEKSADEGNVKYLGKTINHQYSKSLEFEKKFRNYCKKYLAKNINRAHKLCASVNYFSFLRKYTELEIAEMLSKYPKYFSFFLSCNEAYKTDSGRKKPKKKWCGSCSKCLFVYTALYPFLKSDTRILA